MAAEYTFWNKRPLNWLLHQQHVSPCVCVSVYVYKINRLNVFLSFLFVILILICPPVTFKLFEFYIYTSKNEKWKIGREVRKRFIIFSIKIEIADENVMAWTDVVFKSHSKTKINEYFWCFLFEIPTTKKQERQSERKKKGRKNTR